MISVVLIKALVIVGVAVEIVYRQSIRLLLANAVVDKTTNCQWLRAQ